MRLGAEGTDPGRDIEDCLAAELSELERKVLSILFQRASQQHNFVQNESLFHLNNRGRKVVSGGKYVMSKTPMSSTSSMGSTARITSRIGLLKRYDERSRFKPTGGAMKPSSMLARKMIPR